MLEACRRPETWPEPILTVGSSVGASQSTDVVLDPKATERGLKVCQSASSAPFLRERPGRDLRDYLCGETIEGELSYRMHGDYPVAMLSMFTPPNEGR